jgi:FkbH-like protein
MWQTDWAQNSREAGDPRTAQVSALDPAQIGATHLLFWNEHCIECAVPDCYALCPLYVQRRDRKCARLKNGIVPNPQYPGLFPYGAEVEFRRWGKLESTFGFGSAEPETLRRLDQIDRGLLHAIRPVSSLLSPLSPNYRINGAYAVLRERWLQRETRDRLEIYDEFVVEVSNLDSRPVRLVLECWQQEPKFRTSIHLQPGRTMQRIPAAAMNVDLHGTMGFIRVFPENDAEAHLVFSWLDFVKYREPRKVSAAMPQAPPGPVQAAPKVKCVIWDLDQTAWDGILGEQDPDKVSLRPEVLKTMISLDERGILLSIASKNDHETTWSVLQRLGIADLFLYPQINWDPKSASIRRIVASLNIGVDSCVFIDDSPFERTEVAHELPGIRVLTDSDVPSLLDRPEFDVPITSESKQRRTFYVAESERKKESLEYGDRYETFLRTCKMEATLFRPREPDQVERCLELLHRSNQLNLSTYRYSREEFFKLLETRGMMSVCTSCRDRFGDYGIVGFASVVAAQEALTLKDFVLSCRVAQKKLENAWFHWLIIMARTSGYRKIVAPYRKSSRNGVLLRALLECGFIETQKSEDGSVLELDCGATPLAWDVVSVVASDLELSRASSVDDLPSEVRGSRRVAS